MLRTPLIFSTLLPVVALAGCSSATEATSRSSGTDTTLDAAPDVPPSATPNTHDATGKACASDGDCVDPAFACAYAAADACSAHGVCQKVTLSTGCSAVADCACDGTLTGGCDLPAGYAHKPVAYPGACSPLGKPCASDGDCGDPAFACAYDVANACSARGECVQQGLDAACAPDTLCACDGTLTNGCGLPGGSAHKPVGYRQECGPTGKPCASDGDCGDPAFACAFPSEYGCEAQGVCEKVTPSAGCSATTSCACDGSNVTDTCDLPFGYFHRPLAYAGPCFQGGSHDAGGCD
jgi:hypothetical protein